MKFYLWYVFKVLCIYLYWEFVSRSVIEYVMCVFFIVLICAGVTSEKVWKVDSFIEIEFSSVLGR